MAYKIIERCVCCHYCASECPTGAIRFAGSQYVIQENRCVSCGICAKVCPQGIIKDMDTPEQIAAPHETEHLTCDLLVVGAGGSGLIAAVKAAELSGKKVIVLEKGKKPGGSTNLAHGFMVCDCKWLRELGKSADLEQTISRCMEQAEGKLPRSLVEKTVYHTGYFFDWLCEKGDAENYFEVGKGILGVHGINYPYRNFENLKSRDQSIGPGWAGTYVVRKMLQECDRLNIDVLTEHSCIKLHTDEHGVVAGVTASNPAGRVKIACQAVVLATGGFLGNDEKLKKLEPGFFDGGIPVHRFSPVTCSGDGMDLAAALGGKVDMKRTKLNKFGPAHHPFSHSVNRLVGFDCLTCTLDGTLIKEKPPMKMGDTSFMDAIPEHAVWFLLDQEQVDRKIARLIENPPDGNEEWIFKSYMEDVEKELSCDRPLKRADTLGELAVQMGVDPEAFAMQMDEYNNSCDPNAQPIEMDSPVGKMILEPDRALAKAPFYAIFGQRFCEGAFGGVLTSDDMEVVRENGEPIKGLYATGDTNGSWYNRGILGPLTELTWAVTSGYMAGCSVGTYLKN
jgi:fumarate reductase flavoprotein subunit